MSSVRIAGVAVLLFSAVLLGVGIHHLVATGTCSSTGYSANYGPVPRCPSGTGWWFAFVFGGIVGCLIGAAMASGVAFVFAGIFGAIGLGALSIVLDSSATSASKLFGAIFGGCFALVGLGAWIAIIGSAMGSLRSPRAKPPPAPASSGGSAFGTPDAGSAFGTPDAASAFGGSAQDGDPILSAYHASHAAGVPTVKPGPPAPTPLNVIAGIQGARRAAANDSVDELAKLAELHQRGALTDAEFASAKAKLLGEM